MPATLTSLRRACTAAATVALATAATTPASAAERAYPPSPVPDRVVLNPTATPERSQTFSWRTDGATEAGGVEVTPVAGGATARAAARTVVQRDEGAEGGSDYAVHHQTATVTGLEPDTRYRYRVGAEGRWSPWRELRTAAVDSAHPWRFLTFGDAQNGLNDRWPVNVRRAYERVPDARLVVHAGDLINHPTHDVEWGDWFAAQGEAPATINHLATAGNHEYLYDLESVDTSASRFRNHFRHPANGPDLDDNLAYYTDYQDVRFISLSTGLGLDLLALARQRAWLEDVLERNPRRWTVVTFHYPIFSAGIDDGLVRANPQVRNAWLDVLEKHDVDLVLQGHDHTYSRGHRTANGPVYVVSVLGPKYYDLSPEHDNDWVGNGATRVAGAGHTSTFQAVCVSQDRLVYEAIVAAKGDGSTTHREIGETLDAVTIDRSGARKRVVEGGSCAAPTGASAVPQAPGDGSGAVPAQTAPAPQPAPRAATSTTPGSVAARSSSRAALLRCRDSRLLVTGLVRGRTHDALEAATSPEHAGRRAVVRLSTGRVVARPVVGADGTLRARIRVPRGSDGRGARARYRVTVAGASSAWVSRTRRMTVRTTTRERTVTLRGRVTAPRTPGARVTVLVREGCGGWRAVGSATPRRDGTWSTRITLRGSDAVAVRASTTVRTPAGRSVATFTLPALVG